MLLVCEEPDDQVTHGHSSMTNTELNQLGMNGVSEGSSSVEQERDDLDNPAFTLRVNVGLNLKNHSAKTAALTQTATILQ